MSECACIDHHGCPEHNLYNHNTATLWLAGTYNKTTDTGGANGSLMYELNVTAFPINNGLDICPDVIKQIVTKVRRNGCPALTYADAIQVRSNFITK
jgi:hypothetical protein